MNSADAMLSERQVLGDGCSMQMIVQHSRTAKKDSTYQFYTPFSKHNGDVSRIKETTKQSLSACKHAFGALRGFATNQVDLAMAMTGQARHMTSLCHDDSHIALEAATIMAGIIPTDGFERHHCRKSWSVVGRGWRCASGATVVTRSRTPFEASTAARTTTPAVREKQQHNHNGH